MSKFYLLNNFSKRASDGHFEFSSIWKLVNLLDFRRSLSFDNFKNKLGKIGWALKNEKLFQNRLLSTF